MSVEIINSDKCKMTAKLSGEIDHHIAGILRNAIDDAVMTDKPEELVLDFTDVSFMDSSGIGLVMGRYKLQTEQNGRLTVKGTSPQIKKVMKLAGLDRLAKFE